MHPLTSSSARRTTVHITVCALALATAFASGEVEGVCSEGGTCQNQAHETFTIGSRLHGNNRIMLGLWQVSGPAWGGSATKEEMVDAMVEHAEAGFNTYDMADIYG